MNATPKMFCNYDWLEFQAVADLEHLSKCYTVHFDDTGTRFYHRRGYIEYNGIQFITFQSNPRIASLNTNLAILKLCNRFLYADSGLTLLSTFLSENSIEFIAFTRVDISIDFTRLATGDTGGEFIAKVVNGYYLLSSARKVSLSGTVGRSFTANYIRVGALTSDVVWYCYNKTLELKEVKDKPYIRECWNNAGIDASIDVWRIEFRLRGRALSSLFADFAVQGSSMWSILRDYSVITSIASTCFTRYLLLKYPSLDTNLSRHQSVVLFDLESAYEFPSVDYSSIPSNRSDKIFARKLYMHFRRMYSRNITLAYSCESVYLQFVEKANLRQYCYDHQKIWDLEPIE